MYVEKGVISDESTPKCIIKASIRHFNILASDTMMFGFDILWEFSNENLGIIQCLLRAYPERYSRAR